MALSKNTLDELRIDRSQNPGAGSGARITVVLVVVMVALAAAVAWWLKRPKPLEVHTAVVREVGASPGGTQRTVLNASGYVTARRAATVSSKFTGKVMEILVEEGKRVTEGQVLARLDDTNVKASLELTKAQLASAKSALEETRAPLKEAEQNLVRNQQLFKTGIATQAELDHSISDERTLSARLVRQQNEVVVAGKQIEVWQQQMEDAVIRAPFDGIVISKNAQPGEMISPMSSGGFTRTGICTMVDMKSLEIEVDVNESYINRVEPGQAVEAKLDAYPDWSIPCKVIAIIPTADRQKATVKVRVGFDQLDPRILPDMAAKVAFHGADNGAAKSTSSARTLVVPRAALRTIDDKDTVFVVENGKAVRRTITVGASRDEELVVSTGLSVGQSVVIDAPKELADGAAVKEAKP
jgi:RND family efflux transporter MFP subunit